MISPVEISRRKPQFPLCLSAFAISAVSYTHLDVYKRQVYYRLRRSALLDMPRTPAAPGC